MDKKELLTKKMSIMRTWIIVTENSVAHSIRDMTKKPDSGWTMTKSLYHSAWGDEPADFYHERALFTFKGCIDIELGRLGSSPDTEEREVRITVHSGDPVLGNRTSKRSTFVLTGPWWDVPEIAAAIEGAWVRHTKQAVKAAEERRLEKLRQKISEQILAGTYPVNKE